MVTERYAGYIFVKVVLIACAKRKQSGRHRAKDLYMSPLFRFARSYAERHFDQMYILSAQYGLLEPERFVKKYDTSLRTLSKTERLEWSKKVADKIEQAIPMGSEIHFLCGKRYREFVIPRLESSYRCVSPLEGLSIGEQLHWYKQQ